MMRLGKILDSGQWGVPGELWQGSMPDLDVAQIRAPLVVVNMAHDAEGVYPVPERTRFVLIKYGVPDDPTGIIPDDSLLALTESIIDWLSSGAMVLVHCLAGESRSSYVTVAVISRLTGWSVHESLAWIKERYEHAKPRDHFWRHLVAIEPYLCRRC